MPKLILRKFSPCFRQLSAKPTVEEGASKSVVKGSEPKSVAKESAFQTDKKTYWHEVKITKEDSVHWNYRKEIVNRLNMDTEHKRVWISILVSTIVGIIMFVWVKNDLLEIRHRQMAKRDRERRERQIAEAEKYPSV